MRRLRSEASAISSSEIEPAYNKMSEIAGALGSLGFERMGLLWDAYRKAENKNGSVIRRKQGMENVISVVFCGGWRFSTREKELEVIKSALKYGNINLETRFDFSNTSFEFIHDDENNAVLANYEGDGGSAGYWNTMDYRTRHYLQVNGGIIFATSKRTLGFANGTLKEF